MKNKAFWHLYCFTIIVPRRFKSCFPHQTNIIRTGSSQEETGSDYLLYSPRSRLPRRKSAGMYNAEMGCHRVGDIPFLGCQLFCQFQLFYILLFRLPFRKFPLPFLAFKEGLDFRPQAARHGSDHVIGIGRVIDGFLFPCHVLTGFHAASQTDVLHAWPDPECPSESDPAALWLSGIPDEAELPEAALKCWCGSWRPVRLPGRRFVS